MIKLSVNINKVATLRNARGGNVPNVLKVAQDCQLFGADGITVHPRPDERHIRYDDVYALRPLITTEFNIEGYPSPKFIDLVCKIKPDQVTLVPDPPEAITSNAGWDTIRYAGFLKEIVGEFQAHNIRVSIFVDTNLENIRNAAFTETDRVELYTEPYANMYPSSPEKALAPFLEAAQIARSVGLGVNAGHDLNLENLNFMAKNIPWLAEVSIGHALISDALYLGLETAIQKYKSLIV
ncbi:pyridoxine 5'-phosphate synthase [Microbacter margulisiae]|uniref:Pyridoxine 5'-phosphate synthase n=1 Tax=Microbacter margulisiae TaxID=1350067 RepID=A0A7W5DQ25_9PORP|nr:pyridoxine 5'-phosphate synthase [Microbacter margulisiae]MBB3186489.1 pyridoxine 5-phosphate synthase [Microbacter margulisiae]